MELKPAPVQEIFEQRGYVVIVSLRPGHLIGEILGSVMGGDGYADMQGPMLVVAETNRADWVEQYRAIVGQQPPACPYGPDLLRYYRVVAE